MQMRDKVFLDSNVVLYLLSADQRKADIASKLLRSRCVVSVQVLNECANVCKKRSAMSTSMIASFTSDLEALCEVVDITSADHHKALTLMDRFSIAFYDAVICASAIRAECSVLYSEDMQDGLRIDKLIRIKNPFVHKLH